MFKKILIANRGEIACRVIRSCRKMGIATVAVYSDADAGALHVEMADEAVRLGPPPAAESYLLGDKIIAACLATGAEAVHPGYGFLSERASFREACDAAGVVFIGPPAKAIAAMGDKIESKKLAKAAGVSVVPGFVGEIDDTDHAVRIASEIGYPVMMKASAGGGGKGMRLAWSETDVRDGFEATKREGLASFGDDRVFIEKFIEQPRHIEIQLLGDSQGNIVYLNERDCSIQRRHQKVVEEAPSPFVTPEMRKAMGEQAVALAQGVGYTSAGTVEFIAGADRSFYFLEMNTRLQVEHPVTEAITGVDLVEAMIRVAAGEPLGFTQGDVRLDGWAIETRIYAEDPYRGFLPSIGRLATYVPPETFGVRVDTGVVEGSEISRFYDPMIAKLITHGKTRADAIAKQGEALDRYLIRGIGHNIDFLAAVMAHPRFQAGEAVTTAFIAEEYPDGFHGSPVSEAGTTTMIAAAAVMNAVLTERAQLIDGQLSGHGAVFGEDWIVELDGERVAVGVLATGDAYELLIGTGDDAREIRITTDWRVGEPLFVAQVQDSDGSGRAREVSVAVDRRPVGFRLTTGGRAANVRVLTPRAAELAAHMLVKVPPDLSRFLLCPMPGLVVSLTVAPGDRVEAGQAVATIEAMKMENILRAEKSAVVKEVLAKVGESLAVDAVIVEFDV
ncbi:acetyl/propionyl/methylcrotonyl-CoA carboxylase subunit alpha [Polymorphobacter sp. PAMC 29334]|uniref:acetyl-CoA carboxylase biotin carboxylase subunit n=1 Tax=Polymorphobacter sp. PAMC 29334 TaxID=2862331 RepID=UPI001C68612E|nr:acetyl/propionyl/methylcrotonyl-CoA carboxylase subunit alpha [Polymorphobacter sp. PAMC 29334]QYE33838.1 acetyl/propionyl/methylcrotonyl-CoA carboxylase subunit alpha [Polymorphobacter sp. PAMC 29334]